MKFSKVTFAVLTVLLLNVEFGFSQTQVATERKQESVIISNSRNNAVKPVNPSDDAGGQTIAPARQTTLNSSGRNAQPVIVEKTESTSGEENRTKQLNSGLRVNSTSTSENKLQKANSKKQKQ
jgi:hypothetical protein